jgi:hypothetical protein
VSEARYVIHLPGEAEEEALAPEAVLPFVRGYACALGERRWLDGQLDQGVPEDTRRMHALQLADSRGWLKYLYLDQPETTRPRRRAKAQP